MCGIFGFGSQKVNLAPRTFITPGFFFGLTTRAQAVASKRSQATQQEEEGRLGEKDLYSHTRYRIFGIAAIRRGFLLLGWEGWGYRGRNIGRCLCLLSPVSFRDKRRRKIFPKMLFATYHLFF